MQPIGKHAIVLGASMAGLATARVLADAYERVTVLERDALPATAAHRKGVPQSRHAHALLAAGRVALEELFCGLTDELVANGALSGDLQAETRWYNHGLRLCPGPSDLRAVAVSRPLLEACVRDRVRALPNVRVVDRCDAAGLVATPDGQRVRGVRVIRHADGSAEEVLGADLVVDATGRGSRSPVWLEELGYPRPAQDEVRIGVAYASRVYRRRDHLDSDRAVVVAATPDQPRGAAMLAMEGDRWMVTLNGYLGQRPPTDPDGFVAFAADLPVPDVFETIRDAQPLGEVLPARYPASVRRRYERLDRFPDGYLVTGDAVCGFNPVYGQGMSVAVLEALALRECLRADPAAGLARRFFAKVAPIVDIPWGIAVGADLRFPGIQGARTAKVRLVNAYLARFHVAAATDPVLGRAFLRVVNLMDRPEGLLRPTVALRVLRGNLRRTATRPRGSWPASRTQQKAA